MEFRVAVKSDAEQIAALHAQSWRRAYRGMMPDEFLDGPVVAERIAVWRERLREERADRKVCLAVSDSRLVGFVCVYGSEDAVWGSYIDNLHVTSDLHRSGIGTSLMRHAAAWLCENYADLGVYLWVMEANGVARRFYERLGARNAGTVMKVDPGGGSAPNCRYVWQDAATLLQYAHRVVGIPLQ